MSTSWWCGGKIRWSPNSIRFICWWPLKSKIFFSHQATDEHCWPWHAPLQLPLLPSSAQIWVRPPCLASGCSCSCRPRPCCSPHHSQLQWLQHGTPNHQAPESLHLVLMWRNQAMERGWARSEQTPAMSPEEDSACSLHSGAPCVTCVCACCSRSWRATPRGCCGCEC